MNLIKYKIKNNLEIVGTRYLGSVFNFEQTII